MSKTSSIPYIQGLRGLAIILIILFHLSPTICPNGFFGVDAFLVISGYFLIGKQLKTGIHFSLPEFMQKKGIRLFPPMLVLCIAMICIASLLPEFAMKEVLEQVQWALCCIPNIKLAAATNDYFAADTRHMPLMHLWYMGCIIQSYLFFSLLFVLWRVMSFRLRGKLLSLGIVFILSLAIRHQSLIHTFGWGGSEYLASTYYMTAARLWELVIGGVLMVCPNAPCRAPRLAAFLSCLAGVSFCFSSFIPLGDGTSYMPVAVFLTAILLLCGSRGFLARLLSSRIMLFIGKISFSLYLVHWPVICLSESYLGIQLSPLSAAVQIAIMGCIGLALYLIAEKRVYRHYSTITIYLICWGLCAILMQTGSLRSLFAKNILDIETLSYNMKVATIDRPLYSHIEGLPVQWGRNDREEPSLIYHLGDDSKEAKFVLLGDSHSENLVAGFDLIGKEKGWSGVYLNSYFHPFWGALYEEAGQPKHTFDQAKGEAFLQWFKAHPAITHIIIAQYWGPRMCKHRHWNGTAAKNEEQICSCRYEELKAFCELMKTHGKQVIILTDNPHIQGKNPRQYVLSKRLKGENDFNDTDFCCTQESYQEQNRTFMTCAERLEQEGFCTIIHMGEALMQEGTFTCMKGNKLLMQDSHHLSYLGGLEAVRLIANDFFNAITHP